jgi:hypothetical protein
VFRSVDLGSWFFGICFAAFVGWFLVLLERLRKEIRSALPSNPVNLPSRLPRSIGQVWRYNVISYSLDLLEQHRRYFPESSLPKMLGIALAGAILSFIGLLVTAV